jgi:urate oxidase
MPAVLSHHAYGKSHVRLTKVTWQAGRHELKELCLDIQLEGEFAASYQAGDNRHVVPTDTMKNIVYVLAKKHPITPIESFGQVLTSHLLESYPQVRLAKIDLVEQPWQRIEVDGQEHPWAFKGGSTDKQTATVTQTRQTCRVESGLDDLHLLKTTESAFAGFVRDAYTTLPETHDRIFATVLSARWFYGPLLLDWDRGRDKVRRALVETFALHKSLAVQQTLYAMAAAALESCEEVDEITLRMPNKHRLLVDLRPFGLTNNNEIFMATEEPYGLITGTVRRE